jgi:hypothetical protein
MLKKLGLIEHSGKWRWGEVELMKYKASKLRGDKVKPRGMGLLMKDRRLKMPLLFDFNQINYILLLSERY